MLFSFDSEREYYPDPDEIYEQRFEYDDPDAFFLDDPRDDEEDEDEIPFDEDM